MFKDKLDSMSNAELNLFAAKGIAKTALVIAGSAVAFHVAVRLIAGDVTKASANDPK